MSNILLNRSTRQLCLTEVGRAYYDRARDVLVDIDDMENAVGDVTIRARGTLRINAPMSFGQLHLTRAIAMYQNSQPEVEVDLTLNVHVVYAHRQYLSAKIRTYVDFLAGYFGSPPYWDRSE